MYVLPTGSFITTPRAARPASKRNAVGFDRPVARQISASDRGPSDTASRRSTDRSMTCTLSLPDGLSMIEQEYVGWLGSQESSRTCWHPLPGITTSQKRDSAPHHVERG